MLLENNLLWNLETSEQGLIEYEEFKHCYLVLQGPEKPNLPSSELTQTHFPLFSHPLSLSTSLNINNSNNPFYCIPKQVLLTMPSKPERVPKSGNYHDAAQSTIDPANLMEPLRTRGERYSSDYPRAAPRWSSALWDIKTWLGAHCMFFLSPRPFVLFYVSSFLRLN